MTVKKKFRTRLSQATIEEENEAFKIASDYYEKSKDGFIPLSQLGVYKFIVEEANLFLRHIMDRNDHHI